MTSPLSLKHGGRTLVTYAFHEYNQNVRFFLRHGLAPNDKVDYTIVRNHVDWSGPVDASEPKELGSSLVKWIKRGNTANDFGAYSESLKQNDLDQYDYFVFVNSSVRGPFTQDGDTEHWSTKFTKKLNDSVAIVGSTINYMDGIPHVQSMIMALDQRGLQINMDAGVFLKEDRFVPKGTLIRQHEIQGSTNLLKVGYNMDCLVTAYQGKDWRRPVQHFYPSIPVHYDLWGDQRYWGHNLHPMETVFFKTNRKYDSSNTIVPLMTEWYESKEWMNEVDPEAAREALALLEDDLHPAVDLVRGEEAIDSDRGYFEHGDTMGDQKSSKLQYIVWISLTATLAALAITFMILWAKK